MFARHTLIRSYTHMLSHTLTLTDTQRRSLRAKVPIPPALDAVAIPCHPSQCKLRSALSVSGPEAQRSTLTDAFPAVR